MRQYLFPRWVGLALLAMVSTMSIGSRASADQVVDLYFDGSYNHTSVYFSYTGGGGVQGVSGGGDIGISLDNKTTAVQYNYCLQFNVDVWVPVDYNQSLLNTTGSIHHSGGLLDPFGNVLSGSLARAENAAYLITTFAGDASGNGDKEAALQASIWAQVTPGFNLEPTSNNRNSSTLVDTYNNDNTNASNSLANSTLSQREAALNLVIFLTPSSSGNNVLSGGQLTDNFQAQIAYTPGSRPHVPPPVPTPEPSAIAMALSGLIPLGVVALKRRRRAAASKV